MPELVSKRFSFYQLFAEFDFTVEIPSIQRDYAQGRESKFEVRELFLSALFDYLQENLPNRDLDFVYGSTEKLNGSNKFIPLDGQQRLTTLFLLHWYLANRSGNIEEFRRLFLVQNKSRFTYTTRPSSSEFIDALVINDINLGKQLPADDGKSNSLSKTIKDKGWFFLSWTFDPTIQSFLNMLDSIDAKFRNYSHYYERLSDLKNPIITFLFLDLKEFKLTDDLYIKMNSRGKPLTSFENFKAKLEQFIDELYADESVRFHLNSKQVTYREYFSFKIDTTWADLFWHYRKLVGKPNTYDEELMNFIRVIISNQFAIDNSSQIDIFKELIKSETATADITENLSFFRFKDLGALSKNVLRYLINSLDVLENDGQKIKEYLSDHFYFDEKEIFDKALKYSLSLPERVMFHAYLRFLIVHKESSADLSKWMRVVHNLVENSRIEDAEQLINAIKSIEKLFSKSDAILEYLAGRKYAIDFFAGWQVEEECLKAHLILKSQQWAQIIIAAERQVFHKGQLAYLFEFSGVWDYFKLNKHVNWSDDENVDFLDSFISYETKSVALFEFYESENNQNYLLERALLTKGNYLIPASSNRFNLCSSKNVANYQRDYSWKRLLRLSTDISDGQWKMRRNCVKALLDDVDFSEQNISKSLKKIMKNTPEDWRGYLIRNSKLIDYCKQGFLYMSDNDDDMTLYNASRFNHYHINMFDYNFYTEYLLPLEDSFIPFSETYYKEVRGDERTYAYLNGWCYKKKYYIIKVYRWENGYSVEFEKEKGIKKQSEFDTEIVSVLNKNGFEWYDENNAYYKIGDSESVALQIIKKLCVDFIKL